MKTITTKVDVKGDLQKKLSENQFYGLRYTLDYFQQVPKMTDNVNKSQLFEYLSNTWNECKNDVEKRKLFFSIFFKHLDVSNRDHNFLTRIYGKNKSDKGGDALRKVGIYQLEWMLSQDISLRNQFYEFLPLIPEYSNFENIFFNQLRTDRKTGKVLEVISVVPESNKTQILNEITNYLASKIQNVKTSDFEHQLMAKFLPKPKFSKRKRTFVVSEAGLKAVKKRFGNEYKVGDVVERKSSLQDATIKKEQFEADFITILSTKLNWQMIHYPYNVRYVGLEEYKAKWNRLSEAYLFSSKEILKMDKDQFIKWLNNLPSGSRFRVQCRLFNKDKSTGKLVSTGKWISKYGDLADFYNEWLNTKAVANQKVRELESKETLTEEETLELRKTLKEAKVNVAAESILDVVSKLIGAINNSGVKELDIIADNILRKIDIRVPALFFIDRSGSMTSRSCNHNGVSFSARDISKIALTAFLLKAPDKDLQSIFGLFSSQCEIITDGEIKLNQRANKYVIGNPVQIKESIVDRTKPFSWNFTRISQIIDGFELATSTDISTIPTKLKQWTDSDPSLSESRKELIRQYKVWVVISDGDINNSHNATASVQDFKHRMLQYFGMDDFILVIWDIKDNNRRDESNKFENIENVMYFGSANQQVLQQIFCNIHDLDIIDIYTPLISIYRSNRYEPVRNKVK